MRQGQAQKIEERGEGRDEEPFEECEQDEARGKGQDMYAFVDTLFIFCSEMIVRLE